MPEGICRRELFRILPIAVGFPAFAPLRGLAASSERLEQWNYVGRPVAVTNPDLRDNWIQGARLAFDGYGGADTPLSIARCWAQQGRPTPAKPFVCTIDYGAPVAISKFRHYFYTPEIKDYRTNPFLQSTAFAAVNVYRSDDGSLWTPALSEKNLPADWPQVLTIAHPSPARHYKIEVTALVEGADGMRTYEIESFTGPAIHDPRVDHVDKDKVWSGTSCTLRGRVAAMERISNLSVRVMPSADVRTDPRPAPLTQDLGFEIPLTPLRAGLVPVTLELLLGGEPIDRRSLTLQVSPRLAVSNIRIQGRRITGALTNNFSERLQARVGSGERSSRPLSLAPREAVPFEMEVPHPDLSATELLVAEDETVRNKWRFSIEPEPVPRGRLSNAELRMEWETSAGSLHLRLHPRNAPRPIDAVLQASLDGTPLRLIASHTPAGGVSLWASYSAGSIVCDVGLQDSAIQAVWRRVNDGIEEPSRGGVLEIRLKTQGVRFRFVPAYVYSRKPIQTTLAGVYGPEAQSTIVGGWQTPTRMVALQTDQGTVGFVPDRDRCHLGIENDDAVVRIHLGDKPVKVLLPAVHGDWFESFRYVVTRIYRFEEPRQYRPLTVAVADQMRYLAGNEDIWSTRMEVLTSFPKREYVYVFYGLTYSIPALYSWYLMSGDEQALERVRKCVRWLLEYPGVRVTQGPAAGAIFSQYISPEEKQGPGGGCDQANNRWIEPHATGAAAWVLLHYYLADGQKDKRVLKAIEESLDWLAREQQPTGGWVYAYHPDGSKVTEEEDAGNIWNIWALWRCGRLTGEKRYLEAAERGKRWFAKKFIDNHVCRGYWEDVSGARERVGLSWESYEFAVAAVAFQEMGDAGLAVASARNAATWIWTRVVDYRSYFTSYGHAHEQWGWAPASYVAPMFGLAAQAAYALTGDPFFEGLAGAAKTIGWWTVRKTPSGIWPDKTTGEKIGFPYWPEKVTEKEIGSSIWPPEAGTYVPVEEPFTVTYWVDWITAQQASICLRWLINELNRRSGGAIAIDPVTLAGTVQGKPGKISLRPGEVKLERGHEQMNWLVYRAENVPVLGVINTKESSTVKVALALPGVIATTVSTTMDGKSWSEKELTGGDQIDVEVPAGACVLVRWKFGDQVLPKA